MKKVIFEQVAAPDLKVTTGDVLTFLHRLAKQYGTRFEIPFMSYREDSDIVVHSEACLSDRTRSIGYRKILVEIESMPKGDCEWLWSSTSQWFRVGGTPQNWLKFFSDRLKNDADRRIRCEPVSDTQRLTDTIVDFYKVNGDNADLCNLVVYGPNSHHRITILVANTSPSWFHMLSLLCGGVGFTETSMREITVSACLVNKFIDALS